GVLSEKGDARQPIYLLVTLLAAMAYVVLNTDGGFGFVPDQTALPLFGLAASTDDMREGVTAFLAKRQPEFRGR
ncbi:MAG: hypothetical protein MUQ27_14190, partial [Acidimicrobiia bacterium]|nr:hypothetical protein [Acidimicrobiia bacterium]